MSDVLAEAVAELERYLPAAAALTAQSDTAGPAGPHATAVPAAPWNTAAAEAVTTACEGAHRLEASLRLQVTGGPGRRRSYGQTGACLRAVAALGWAVADDTAAARFVERWALAIRRLPGIDDAPVWRPIRSTAARLVLCPSCGTPSLRMNPGTGVVRCFFAGVCGRPWARMEVGVVSGEPVLIWSEPEG